MAHDTDLGGAIASFPLTRHSAVREATSADVEVRKQAFQDLVTAYWKPVYKYVRVKWNASNEDAKDLTQAFFLRLWKEASATGSIRRGPAFALICASRSTALSPTSAKRRGESNGAAASLSCRSTSTAPRESSAVPGPRQTADPTISSTGSGCGACSRFPSNELRRDCQASGKETHFLVFERYDLEGPDRSSKPTYGELALEFGLSPTQVTNYLAAMRREFRRLVLERIRATTGSDDEFREESRRLLGGHIE